MESSVLNIVVNFLKNLGAAGAPLLGFSPDVSNGSPLMGLMVLMTITSISLLLIALILAVGRSLARFSKRDYLQASDPLQVIEIHKSEIQSQYLKELQQLKADVTYIKQDLIEMRTALENIYELLQNKESESSNVIIPRDEAATIRRVA